MTDTEAPLTIVDKLKLWQEALEDGDVRSAVEYHDEVQAHIMKHQDGARVFKLAEMNPQAFIHWSTLKPQLKEQLNKTSEQRQADYEEARDAFGDLAEKLLDAKTARDLIALVGKINPIAQQLLVNAGVLDEAKPLPKDQLKEKSGGSPPPEKKKRQRKKAPKNSKPA